MISILQIHLKIYRYDFKNYRFYNAFVKYNDESYVCCLFLFDLLKY